MDKLSFNKKSSLTAHLKEEPKIEENISLEVKPIKLDKINNEDEDEIGLPNPEQIFEKMPTSKPIPIPTNKKKKRPLSERQKAHLLKMQARSREVRSAKKKAREAELLKKKQEQLLKKQQEIEKLQQSKKFINVKKAEKKIQQLEEQTKDTMVAVQRAPSDHGLKNTNELQQFFNNMHSFLDVLKKMKSVQMPQAQPKQTPIIKQKKTQPKKVYKTETPTQRATSIFNNHAAMLRPQYSNAFGL